MCMAKEIEVKEILTEYEQKLLEEYADDLAEMEKRFGAIDAAKRKSVLSAMRTIREESAFLKQLAALE